MKIATTLTLSLLLGVCLLAAPAAQAQEWPTKPVRVIVPFPPGGGTDTVARPLTAKLSQLTGHQFVIDNRGGAGGTIGAAMAAKATPDGYTVLLSPVHVAVAVSAYKSLPYDLEKDLTPVTTVAVFPDVLVAATRVPAKTLPELIAYAKANPGKVNCGSAGNGTTRHLACEMFNSAAGIKAEHVPYKGTGPATTALLGGEIDYIFEALGSASQHIRSGKLKAIAVTSVKRSPSFPEIPTAIESGLPGFDVTSWYGLWVPTGSPPAVVQRLHALVQKAFEDPEIRDLWFKLGAEPGGLRQLRAHRGAEVGQGRARRGRDDRVRAGAHLPMQKRLKISPSRSSAVIAPVISPSASCAWRRSSASRSSAPSRARAWVCACCR